MVTINYKDIPKVLLPQLKRTINKYKSLIPSWCHELNIYWDSSISEDYADAAARMLSRPEYRFADMYIQPLALDVDLAAFEEFMLHEIIHLFYEEMHHYTLNLVNTLDIDPHFKKHISEQIRIINECTTTDLSKALSNVFKDR